MAGQAKLRGDFMKRRQEAIERGRMKKDVLAEQSRKLNQALTCLLILVDRAGGEMKIEDISSVDKRLLELYVRTDHENDCIVLTTKEVVKS